MAAAHASAHGGTAPADGPGQHHRRAVLPQPVRRARGRLRPPARNIHGTDEAVELASIVSGARTLARFIAGFFATGGLRGEPLGHDAAEPDRRGRTLRRAPGPGADAHRGRADRRAPRHRDRARRVRAGPATAHRAGPVGHAGGEPDDGARGAAAAAGRGLRDDQARPRRRHLRPDRRGSGFRRDDQAHAGPGLGRADRAARLPAARRAADRAHRGRAPVRRRHRGDPPGGRRVRARLRPGCPQAGGRTRCTRPSRGPRTTPASSTCPRGSAARSASASTPNRTRPRCAAARCTSIPTLAEAIIAGDPGRAARLADNHFSLTDDHAQRLARPHHLRSGGDTDARSQGQ